MNPVHQLEYKTLCRLSQGLAAGGTPRIRALARILGAGLWHLLPPRRALAVRTIAERLNMDETAARTVARQSFTHNAQSFLEIVLAPEFGFDRQDLRVDRPDILEKLRQGGRPLVVTTAHLGAWELSAGLAGDFLPQPFPRMIVVRNHSNPAIRDYMFAMRGGRGSQIIGHRNAAFTALKTLRKNGLVGFLADHNTGSSEAIFLPFLDKVAAVNSGPAVLAVRAKALIWPLVVVREGEGYALLCEDPLDTALLEGDVEERVRAAAVFYTGIIESWVRRYPEQWFWMHKRWKTRPPDEGLAPQS